MVHFEITGILKELERATEQAIRRLGIRVVENLIAPPDQGGTPRDTGHAASNWIGSVGTPSTEVAGSKEQVTTTSQEIGLQALARYKLSDGPMFVSNNVPYIERLNAGSSKQAPVGFIESAVLRAAEEVG